MSSNYSTDGFVPDFFNAFLIVGLGFIFLGLRTEVDLVFDTIGGLPNI